MASSSAFSFAIVNASLDKDGNSKRLKASLTESSICEAHSF